jgi:hypothetical protein
MNKQKLPSQQELNDRFIYKDGQLYYKGLYEYLEKHYPTDLLGNTPTETQLPVACLQENTKYQNIWVDDKPVLLHRLIFKMHTGEEPETVDHIDGNTHNNKIENLRSATRSQQLQNRKVFKSNKVGLKNISPCYTNKDGTQVYRVQIKNQQSIIYKSFTDLKDAIEFRNSKLKELHGEFSRHE